MFGSVSGAFHSAVHRLDLFAPRTLWASCFAILLLCGFGWQRCGVRGCPRVERLAAYQPNGATVLLDRHGNKFADLAPTRRRIVPLKSLPAHVSQAFLAVEDRRFYSHNGVDWQRVGGAAFANVRSGRLGQGSSTITMQLTRNLFPKQVRARDRTFRRKLLEMRVARMVERRFEKDEVLELYLNHIYFGNGAYGIEAASQHYFRKSATKLTASQSALLAALVKAPTNYDPRRRATRAKERRNLVLTLMEQQGRLTSEKANAARKTALGVSPPPARGNQDDGLAPYFVDTVRRLLEEKFGELPYERRLKVFTTLDIKAQRAAEDELFKQLRTLEAGGYGPVRGPRYTSRVASGDQGSRYLQGSVVLLEVATGDVIALVGGRDFDDSPFNRATQGLRQVGSAFKPFVYAAAIENGVTASHQLTDEPISIDISRRVSWEPRNYDGEFLGRVSMREALVQSRNVPTVSLASEVGLDLVRLTAQRAGFTGNLASHPSMPLGTVASSPLELARIYTVFPGLGTRPDARFIVRVEDEDGRILWQTTPRVETGGMDPRAAYIVTDMMRDVIDRGTGSAVRRVGFYGAAAGKTGTTSEGADTWFVGFTPDVVGAVWIGFDRHRTITANASGGRLAAPVWGRIMKRVYDGRPDPGDFRMPSGVVERTVDPDNGLILQEGCWPGWGQPARELFIEGNEPDTTCPLWGGSRWSDGPSFEQHETDLADGRGEIERLLRNTAGDPRLRAALERYLNQAIGNGIDLEAGTLQQLAHDWIRNLPDDPTSNDRRRRSRR